MSSAPASIAIPAEDLEIEPWPIREPGGQHVSGDREGIKITHKPTGLAACVATERSRRKNQIVGIEMLATGLEKIGYRPDYLFSFEMAASKNAPSA
jgi:protein subunit release factor A